MYDRALLASILQGPFLVEGQALQLLYAEFAQYLTAGPAGESRPVKQLGFSAFTPHAAALGVQSYSSLDEVPAGSIAVHTVAGVMLPEDSWYSVGTKTIGQRVQQADAHPSFIGHVGVFNTPGGSTMGLENFAGIIAGTQKPFVSHVQQACSAGYWSASGGNVLMLAGRTAMCGSIGTMAQFLDFTGYLKQLGIEQITAYATKSTDKNAAFQAAVDGDVKPLQEEILDPLNEVFLNTVLTNRAEAIDPKTAAKTVLTGKVFVGQANVDNGLADVLGSLDDAIALAQQLAETGGTSSATSSSTPHPMFGKDKFSAVAALAGLAATGLTADLVTAANDELEKKGVTGAQLITEAAFNDLTAKASRADAAEASLQGITEALTAAGVADVAALVTQRNDYKVKADQFDKGPGAGHTTPTLVAGATDVDPAAPDAHAKAIAELPHNKALDGHPVFG